MTGTVAGTRAGGEVELLEEVWAQLRAALVVPSSERTLHDWLERVEPVALRDGTLELVTRSPRAASLLRERLAPLLERAAKSVLGAPVRVRIDIDQSLGGALRALGLKRGAGPAAPPPFLVRPETRLAHAALLRTAREPSPEFDLLLVEGPAGVGKTLLVATFVHQRAKRFPREHWRREHGADFFRAFSEACRDRARATFRGERVACDGFVLDDAHELLGKLHCQEQLVEMLEYFRARRRPVVISSAPLDGGPRELLPQLRSILRSGLRLAIPQLSAASRAEILRFRVRRGAPLGWLIDELARGTDVPLATCLKACARGEALHARLGRTPKPEELEEELGPLFPRGTRAEPMDRILDRCAAFVGSNRDALVSGARTRAAALGRHLAIYLALEVFRLQRATVKRWLGNLSPSVLPYVRQKIETLRASDARLDGFLREVGEEIGRGQRFLFGG